MNRHKARHGGRYYLKAATFAPVGIVGEICLVFPSQFYGKPETTREKVIVSAVFGIGAIY